MPSNEILEERIATRIAKATDILHKCSNLIPQIVTAGQQLTDCILNDGKILVLEMVQQHSLGKFLQHISCIVSSEIGGTSRNFI